MNNNGTLAIEKVTNIETKQAAAQCEFKIACTLRGFPIEISGSGRAADLKIIVDRLFDMGAEPPSAQKPEPAKQSGTPTCPVHNTPMKQGRHGYFCPKKVGDGYCKETA